MGLNPLIFPNVPLIFPNGILRVLHKNPLLHTAYCLLQGDQWHYCDYRSNAGLEGGNATENGWKDEIHTGMKIVEVNSRNLGGKKNDEAQVGFWNLCFFDFFVHFIHLAVYGHMMCEESQPIFFFRGEVCEHCECDAPQDSNKWWNTWNLEPDSHPFINAWKEKHPIFKAIVAGFRGFSLPKKIGHKRRSRWLDSVGWWTRIWLEKTVSVHLKLIFFRVPGIWVEITEFPWNNILYMCFKSVIACWPVIKYSNL